MPKREVTSAPWVPVPARAYTGKAPRARQHRAVGRLSAGAPRAGHPTARAVKASAPLKTAARRPLVVVVAATPNYLRQASQNLGKYISGLLWTGVRHHPPATPGGPTITSADFSVPRPVFPDHMIDGYFLIT